MIRPGTVNPVPAVAWPWSCTLPRLGALPTAPGLVRVLVRHVLTVWDLRTLAEDCVLIASELVANAVTASTAPSGLIYVEGRMPMAQVCLMSDGVRVLIEVHDQAPGEPVPSRAAPDAESGRGLQMIDALTGGDWGWYTHDPRPGKCVWAALPPLREVAR
jgi:anti-sigma regulatory factor (Ser/Thr protein kinase)